MRLTLQNVPSTLEQTYRNILASIPKDDVPMARETLFWLTFSLYPMTLEALCEAVITGEENLIVNDEVRLLHRHREALLKVCGSLISYNTATTRVALAHSSVREFLTSQEIQTGDVRDFFLDESTADIAIARRCLRYMCLPAFRSGYCPSKAALTQRLIHWPLLRYIAETLFNHLSHVCLDEQTKSLLLDFFATYTQPRGGNFGAWVQAFFPIAHKNIESSTPLYYAARWGLLSIVRVILETEGTKNLEVAGGMYGSTPLHVAVWQGRTEMVKELLKAGANAKEVNQEGKPGLIWAVKYGYRDMEQLLREAGADLAPLVARFGFRDEEQMCEYAETSWAARGGARLLIMKWEWNGRKRNEIDKVMKMDMEMYKELEEIQIQMEMERKRKRERKRELEMGTEV